jgi:pyridoxal phosphate enzyme (YggS family)
MNTLFKPLSDELKSQQVSLIAVSKTKPIEQIRELYDLGQRDFGENKVQELDTKQDALPKDIRWHLIGHLQSNKVKTIVPYVHLIHSVDSLSLLTEINKQAQKINRVVDVLLQIYIAQEESKFGLDETEFVELLDYYTTPDTQYTHVRICGVMGMATNTPDLEMRRTEFKKLKSCFQFIKESYFPQKDEFREISMGMSDDFKIAIEEGATMVRIGSLLFGSRQ